MDEVLSVDCVSSESQLEPVEIPVAGELRVDSDTGYVGVLVVWGS